mgnify:FL=1
MLFRSGDKHRDNGEKSRGATEASRGIPPFLKKTVEPGLNHRVNDLLRQCVRDDLRRSLRRGIARRSEYDVLLAFEQVRHR